MVGSLKRFEIETSEFLN